MTWKDAAWFPVIGSVRGQWTLDSRGATQHPTDASTALHLHAKRAPHCRRSPFASRFTPHALVRGTFFAVAARRTPPARGSPRIAGRDTRLLPAPLAPMRITAHDLRVYVFLTLHRCAGCAGQLVPGHQVPGRVLREPRHELLLLLRGCAGGGRLHVTFPGPRPEVGGLSPTTIFAFHAEGTSCDRRASPCRLSLVRTHHDGGGVSVACAARL